MAGYPGKKNADSNAFETPCHVLMRLNAVNEEKKRLKIFFKN
jgi:hypothetical protein